MKKNFGFNLSIGMPEFMLLTGAYMFSDAKYIALSLIVLGVGSGFFRYCMERNDADEKDKETKRLLKEMTDSVTALSLSKAIPTNSKNGGYH